MRTVPVQNASQCRLRVSKGELGVVRLSYLPFEDCDDVGLAVAKQLPALVATPPVPDVVSHVLQEQVDHGLTQRSADGRAIERDIARWRTLCHVTVWAHLRGVWHHIT